MATMCGRTSSRTEREKERERVRVRDKRFEMEWRTKQNIGQFLRFDVVRAKPERKRKRKRERERERE